MIGVKRTFLASRVLYLPWLCATASAAAACNQSSHNEQVRPSARYGTETGSKEEALTVGSCLSFRSMETPAPVTQASCCRASST